MSILGVFTAYYFRRKSRGLQYEERQSLFDAELAGTVEIYPHDKRIEEIRPGVWVAFDYALANVLIIERNSEWERAATVNHIGGKFLSVRPLEGCYRHDGKLSSYGTNYRRSNCENRKTDKNSGNDLYSLSY